MKSHLRSLKKFFHTTKEVVPTKLTEKQYVKQVIERMNADQLKQAYNKAWEAKNFEIDNYWKRGNYFWAFQVAAFAGYFSVLGSSAYQSNPQVLYAIICIGIVTSFAWTLTNNGSKTWQEHWEIHVDLLENYITGPLYKTVTADRTFSASRLNDIVSIFFIVIWFVLGLKYFMDHLSFNLKDRANIDILVLIATLATVAFVFAMYKGHGRGRFGEREITFYVRNYDINRLEKDLKRTSTDGNTDINDTAAKH